MMSFAGYGNGNGYSAGVQPDYASKYHFIKEEKSLCVNYSESEHFPFFPGLGQGVPAANGKSGTIWVATEDTVKDKYNMRVK